MKTMLAFAVISLQGCSLISQAPTMQYCSEVQYSRIGNQIAMSAKCAAPIGGGSGLPVPGL